MPITIDGTGTITGATTLASTVASPTFTTPALGIPTSGTLTNCTGYAAANLPAGSVIQVVQSVHGTVTSTTSATYADTGLTVNITPSSISNKILVRVSINWASDSYVAAATWAAFNIVRTSTQVAETAVGNYYDTVNANSILEHLDSPSTTSSTTYKVQIKRATGSGTMYYNYKGYSALTTSSITVMEIRG